MTDTPEVEAWCPHPQCHDRLHGDPIHTDENGRPFLTTPTEDDDGSTA